MDLISILLLAAALRVLSWTTRSTDDMVHLWNVRLRRKHGNIRSHEPLDSVLPGKRGYPTLAHSLVSLFPQEKWRLAGKSLNIGYDLVLVLLAWVVAGALFPMRDGGFDPRVLSAALVATSPVLLPITSRVKSMGGRTLGCLFAFGYFNALWFGMNGHVVLGLVMGVVCFLLAVLTSKFALQAVLFTTPFVALLSWDPFPLLVLGISVPAAFFVPGLGLRDVLSFMFAHSRWYLRNMDTGTTASARNRLGDILSLPHMFRANKDVFFGILFRRSSYFIALYSFPLVWFVLIWTLGGEGRSYVTYAAHLSLAACCVFLLTSLRPLLFLGQAERYLEYVVPFAAIVVSACLESSLISSNAALSILFFQVAMSLVNCIYSHHGGVKQAVSATGSGAAQQFVDGYEDLSILTIPTKLAFDFSTMQGKNRFYYRAINTPDNGLLYKEDDYAWFEMPRGDLSHFRDKYGIDTVVASKPFLVKASARDVDYGLDRYPVMFEDEEFLVVSIVGDGEEIVTHEINPDKRPL